MTTQMEQSTPEQELQKAQQAYQDIGVRIASGDAKVTPGDLDKAHQALAMAEARVEFAAEAERRERVEVAMKQAEEVRKRFPEFAEVDAKLAKSQAAAEKALRDHLENHWALERKISEILEAAREAAVVSETGLSVDMGEIRDGGTSYQTPQPARYSVEEIVRNAWSAYCEHYNGRYPLGPFS